RWHKLHSKAGKKEKERGEILVSIQFTRNSLTASMFDLSMKDKPRSPFGKLKDKVTGKKKYDLESASAIIPSSMGGLDMEDDFELGGKKSKVKGFFLKNKLRKSSLSQSNTSLGSDSTISSASLSLAGNAAEGSKSPSRHGSLATERSGRDLLPSPKLSHKRAFSDDVSQVSAALEPQGTQSPGPPRQEPVSRSSSLCINGSHVYGEELSPRNVPTSAPLPLPRRQDEAFTFTPLHPDPQEVPWGLSSLERAQQRDEHRFIPSPPSLALQEELKVSTKAVTLSNHLGRARMEESKASQAAAPPGLATEPGKDRAPEDARKEEKKVKGGFFHHGGSRSDAGGKGDRGSPVHASAAGDERSKSSGWFGSKEHKESPQKPSPSLDPALFHLSFSTSGLDPSLPFPHSCFPSACAACSWWCRVPQPPAARLGTAELCPQPEIQAGIRREKSPCTEQAVSNRLFPSGGSISFSQNFWRLPELSQGPKALGGAGLQLWAVSWLLLPAEAEEDTGQVWGAGWAWPPLLLCDSRRGHPRAACAPRMRRSRLFSVPGLPSGVSGWGPMGAGAEPCPCPGDGIALPEAGRGWAQEEGAWQSEHQVDVGCPHHTPPFRVLPRSSLPPEALPGGTVVAVPPRRFPEAGAEPGAGRDGALDIRSSVFRLQASMRLQAGESLLKLSSDSHERHVGLSPWAAAQEPVPGPAVPPPKPPRWFAATGALGDGEEGEPGGTQRGKQQQWEDSEGPRAEMEVPRSHVAEQFETCISKFCLDGLEQSGAEESWSQPRVSPQIQGATDSAKWDRACKQELFPEELSISGLNPPSKLDLGQAASGTVLEEQEAAGHPHPQPQRSEAGEQPCAPPEEAEQGSEEPQGHWAQSRIDFKKADFWKPDRAEERHTQAASALRNPLRNPFTLALNPNSPSNPFMEKPPALLPVQAVLPEKLEQSHFSFLSLQEEAPGHGLQPTNATPLHASQPLAFSTPFLVAATNPEPCGPSRSPAGLPCASPAAARPQPGDAQASALLVLPRETRPAEKPLCQQTSSPHPVKPLSAVQEGSSDKKQQQQQHRGSLSSALSNGLERLKMVTTSSVQPLAPASHPDKSDPKVKDSAQLDQSAKYYHLTHDELIQLLLQKESELSKKEEHIQELENYIDQLLVRIMEQSPTLLQIPLG
ncbi:RFIP5 protein, partial [Erythrocercus mccallii]|nr:RFIP5 protein [Erythrocercus mccallii]